MGSVVSFLWSACVLVCAFQIVGVCDKINCRLYAIGNSNYSSKICSHIAAIEHKMDLIMSRQKIEIDNKLFSNVRFYSESKELSSDDESPQSKV